MEGVTLSIRGDKAVQRRLMALPRNLRKRALQQAARNAMKPVLAAARSNAPKGETGNLRKAVKSKVLRRNRKGLVGQVVSISDKWFQGDQFYGAFQEFGWKTGKRQSKNPEYEANRRQIPGKHFVEQAYKTQGETALRLFMSEVPKAIDRVIASEANKA